MVNKPKAIGTAAETAVRNYLLSCGYDKFEAHRNVLKGSADEGDVWLRHPNLGLIVFEVKAGKAAESASHNQVKLWFEEALIEQKNAGAMNACLVLKRKAVGHARARDWWAYFLAAGMYRDFMVRTTLEEYLTAREMLHAPQS